MIKNKKGIDMAIVTKSVSESGSPVAYTVKDIFGNGERVYTYQDSVERFWVLSRDFHGPTKSEFTYIEPFEKGLYHVGRLDHNGWVIKDDDIVLYAESNERDSVLPFWSSAIDTYYARLLIDRVLKTPLNDRTSYKQYDMEEPLINEIYRNFAQWTPFHKIHPVKEYKSYKEDHNPIRLLSTVDAEEVTQVVPNDYMVWGIGLPSYYAVALMNLKKLIEASPERHSIWVKRTPQRDHAIRRKEKDGDFYIFYFGFAFLSEKITRGDGLHAQFYIQIPSVPIKDVFEEYVDLYQKPVYLSWWNFDDSKRTVLKPHEAIMDSESKTGLVYDGYGNITKKYIQMKSTLSK